MLRFANCCVPAHSERLVTDEDFVQRCAKLFGMRKCSDDKLLSELAEKCAPLCNQFTEHCSSPKCDALFGILSRRDGATCKLPGDVLCDKGADHK